jgi:cyclic-di-AMP phosphodiesterase PgpH
MADQNVTILITKIRRINRSKLLLNLILILVVFLACYVENIYLFFLTPQSGETAVLTFRSQSSFVFDRGKAFEGLRNAAVARYIPIYDFVPNKMASTKEKMEALIGEVSQARSQGKTGRANLVAYLQKEFGGEANSKTALRFIRYPDLKKILVGFLTIQESVFQSKIVGDPEPLKGKMTVRVLFPEPTGLETLPVEEITTLEKARLSLQQKVDQLFSQVDPEILRPFLQLSLAALQPNLRYDQKENDRRIKERFQEYPTKILTYNPGDVLVPFRKVMNAQDVLLLATAQEVTENNLYANLPWVLFIICFSVLLYNLQIPKIFLYCGRKRPPYQLFLTVLILTILLSEACLLFTPYPIYVLPFAILPLMLVLLQQERISITFTTLLGALLMSLLSGRNLGTFLFFIFGGLVAILASSSIRKRSHILIPSLVVGTINALVVLLLSAGSAAAGLTSWQAVIGSPWFGHMGWAFVGGIAAGPIVLLLLPLLELSWHNTSAFKLNKFSDLQHPLMIELLTKAPGTYQHVMSAAHLAYTLGEAIGANSLLLRVAAYYHDIGKTLNPDFFVENLFGRESPHDPLPARESTRIIMDHVRDGKRIALEAGLPEVVADFIPQHHGTRLIEYFYDKAVKENPEAEVSQKDFRYVGPKPQSVEAAILMIVDGVEATSRTMEEPTREKIEAMIRHTILDRITDGQFDECNLSTQEIAKIITVLVHSLEASFHTRVKYPWQQKEGTGSKIHNDKKDPDSAKRSIENI